jgi:hypothetical protein
MKNATKLAWAVKLTGLNLKEIVNLLLADALTCFRPDHDEDEYVENTQGCWKLKDRASAERTSLWVKKKIRKGHRSKFPIVDGRCEKSNPAGSRSTLLEPGATASERGFPNSERREPDETRP